MKEGLVGFIMERQVSACKVPKQQLAPTHPKKKNKQQEAEKSRRVFCFLCVLISRAVNVTIWKLERTVCVYSAVQRKREGERLEIYTENYERKL